MSLEKNLDPTVEKKEKCKLSLLDLPESTLECIFECFSPAELCKLAEVCSYLKARCRSDRLWEKHMKRKWGKVLGDVARQEWQWHMAKRKRENILTQHVDVQNGSLGSFCGDWPILCMGSFLENCWLPDSLLSDYSMMAWYISLEKGKFWFPAQVYRQSGGCLMILCYDALLSYDSQTDTFRARHRYSGWRSIEENIQWDRLRAAPAQNPRVLHVSDCLNDLKPGDHIEVQWRQGKELPYDWWYAVIGHLQSCEGGIHCHCHYSDILVVEFKQYSVGSLYRHTKLNRRSYEEQSVAGGGFYGGIRKLHTEDIERWRRLCPTQILG